MYTLQSCWWKNTFLTCPSACPKLRPKAIFLRKWLAPFEVSRVIQPSIRRKKTAQNIHVKSISNLYAQTTLNNTGSTHLQTIWRYLLSPSSSLLPVFFPTSSSVFWKVSSQLGFLSGLFSYFSFLTEELEHCFHHKGLPLFLLNPALSSKK